MNIFEKLKFFWQLRKVATTMGALLAKFDGLKTLIGVLIVGAYYAAPHFGVSIPATVYNIGLGFIGVGITHKFEKAFGVMSKVIDVAHKVLDGLQAFVDALKKTDAGSAS